MRDLLHNIQVKTMKDPADIADALTWLGYVDTQGFEGIVICYQVGAVTGLDGSNYLTPTLYEADATPGTAGSYGAVAAADIIGAFTPINSASNDSVVQSVGYKGSKRYVALKSVPTGTAITVAIIGSFAIAGLAHDEPADATLTTGAVT